MDLGASPWQRFRHVVLPIIAPNAVGIALFGFTLSYDEFAHTLLTAGSDNTLPLEIFDDECDDARALRAGNGYHRDVVAGDRRGAHDDGSPQVRRDGPLVGISAPSRPNRYPSANTTSAAVIGCARIADRTSPTPSWARHAACPARSIALCTPPETC